MPRDLHPSAPSGALPKVSVCMITYNHEKFIAQAVESVLMQKTDFEYEIIIGEDFSTDRTRLVLVELEKKHPGRLRLVLNPENHGPLPNFCNVLGMARGEYLAVLEGDDYWTSPDKLQRQVDYMEANPDCLLCFHAYKQIREERPDIPPQLIEPLPNTPNKVDGFHCMHAGTFLFRKGSSGPLPAWFTDLRASGEWPLLTWILMQGGKICAVTGPPMSVYRRNDGGVSTMAPRVQRGLDKMHDYHVVTRQMTRQQRKQIFHTPLYKIHLYLCRAYVIEGNLRKARHHLHRYIIHHARPRSRQAISTAFTQVVQCYLPGAYLGFRNWSARRESGSTGV